MPKLPAKPACSPEILLGAVRAAGQIEGDLFPEVDRVKDMTSSQRLWYEVAFAKAHPSDATFEAFLPDVSKKGGVISKISQKISASDKNHLAHMSEQLEGKFWNRMDARARMWEKSKNRSSASFRQMVSKPARKLRDDLKTAIVQANGDKRALNRLLKPYGLSDKNIYIAGKYLEWLGDGGQFQMPKNRALRLIGQAASSVAKAQSNMNIVWTMGNAGDMIRVYSELGTKKGGVIAALQGTADALVKGKGGFSKIKALEKAGIYETQAVDLTEHKFDIFSRSIILQKNIAYHIGERLGGKGYQAVRDVVFDSKPWDPQPFMMDPNSRVIFGLVRYPINESRWLFKKTVDVLKNQDPRALANLTIWATSRAAFFGTASVVPFYPLLPKEWKETLAKIEDDHNLNLLKHASADVFRNFDINASIDMGRYLSPLSGAPGARLESIGTAIYKDVSLGARAAMDVTHGDLDAAAVHGIAAGFALMNFGFFKQAMKFKLDGPLGKLIDAGSKVEKSGFNSMTLTKLLDKTGTFLESDFHENSYGGEVVKAVFGQQNVRKAE